MISGIEASKLIMDEVNKVIIGKPDIVRKVLVCIIAGGHILIEDIPGVGKTTLATAFSRAMSLKYNRMQFTPDVMPSDVTGFSIYNKATNAFEYREGVIMCNMFLADEINRTSSKTQSALLEAMEEGSVTVDGVTRKLKDPFIVIATQNPVGSIGTSMLPESQLDRFMFRISMGYPNKDNEIAMLKDKQERNSLENVRPIVDSESFNIIRDEVDKVFIHDSISEYIVDIVNATRNNEMIKLGVSPRGTIAIAKASKAVAYINGRDYVIPEDVREILFPTINHRIVLSAKAKMEQVGVAEVISEIIMKTPVKAVK